MEQQMCAVVNINDHLPSATGCFQSSRNNKGQNLPFFDSTSPINHHNKAILSDVISSPMPKNDFWLKHQGGHVLQEDFLRLCQGEWLNNVIIGLFMWVFNKREKMKKIKSAQSHFFPVHFFDGLHMSDHGHCSCEKAKACMDQDVDMFACDKLFMPVNVPGHWFCIAVMVKDKRVV